MSSLGKIQGSLFSTSNETSLALLNFNFDFSLRKVEAPREYTDIGRALSSQRRLDAEDGTSHKTARKLGCLFESLVPSTPKLISAYGLRASEILNAPGINPTGTAADGPFKEFVGADCTSIWAAATSGTAAIGIHLLACMLAKAWDTKLSTSIWVELVEARKRQISTALAENHIVNELSLVAAQQEITRSELGAWDSSARSWNERAYQANRPQHDQFLLIIKNASLPFGTEKVTYDNVIGAWTRAMICLENHMNGIQQQVSDGAVLLALSAWHLFPDLAFFGAKAVNVKFSDPLLPRDTTMTLGLQIENPDARKDIRWSLALSHLRYYGDPVSVTSNENSSMLSPSQLNIIALGGVLGCWQVVNDANDALRWLDGLWTYLEETGISLNIAPESSPHTSWLFCLATAARNVLCAKDDSRKNCQALLQFGQRRAKLFLNKSEKELYNQVPYFGLCSPSVMSSLSKELDIECGIQFLRQISQELGLGSTEAIIVYSEYKANGRIMYTECATAVPHTRHTRDRDQTEQLEKEEIHARWINVDLQVKAVYGNACEHPCHQNLDTNDNGDGPIDLDFRARQLRANGEQCIVLQNIFQGSGISSELFWRNAPLMFKARQHYRGCERLDEEGGFCPCFKLSSEENGALFTVFLKQRTSEHRAQFSLFFRDTIGLKNSLTYNDYKTRLLRATRSSVKPADGLVWLKSFNVSKVRVWDYLQSFSWSPTRDKLSLREEVQVPKGLDWTFSHSRSTNFMMNAGISPPPMDWFTSLEALAVVSEIYKNLPSALIAISSVFQPLSNALWIPDGVIRGSKNLLDHMTRERSFACIAMFQTGGKNLNPDDFSEVMAISWENSIFVAGLLLSDPHTEVIPTDIRHIIGNIGHPGLTLLISPREQLRIRPLSNDYRVVMHEPYNYQREDNFQGTSLHLTFTNWKIPLVNVQSETNTIDQDVFFVESVVSLWENGQWTADLDLMLIDNSDLDRIPSECNCNADLVRDDPDKISSFNVRSLDNWEEILDAPGSAAVIRANGNWAARLAAVALLNQLEKGHCLSIVGGRLCWNCVCARYTDPEPHLPEFIID